MAESIPGSVLRMAFDSRPFLCTDGRTKKTTVENGVNFIKVDNKCTLNKNISTSFLSFLQAS